MNFDVRRCEGGTLADGLFFCIDCGTTYIKTLLIDKTGYVYKKYNYEEFPYDKVTRMADFNRCKVIVTGARSGVLELGKTEFGYVYYSEVRCISMLPKSLGIDRAVVACIGTGTPFIAYEKGRGVHLGGTGIGGGTFTGLAERMLGVGDPARVEEMATSGCLPNVNIMVSDIYKNNVISELNSDYTASNFAKPPDVASANRDNDVALGIHSLVGEAVGCMAGQLAKYNGFESVVFCGTVCENKIICGILSDCLSIYGVKPIFIENPGFGTCFGAIMLYASSN